MAKLKKTAPEFEENRMQNESWKKGQESWAFAVSLNL